MQSTNKLSKGETQITTDELLTLPFMIDGEETSRETARVYGILPEDREMSYGEIAAAAGEPVSEELMELAKADMVFLTTDGNWAKL